MFVIIIFRMFIPIMMFKHPDLFIIQEILGFTEDYLPRQYRNYDLYNGYKVVMTDYRGNAPYTYYKEHKRKYAKGYHGEHQKTYGNRPEKGNGNRNGNAQGKKNGKGHKNNKH